MEDNDCVPEGIDVDVGSTWDLPELTALYGAAGRKVAAGGLTRP